MGDFVSAFVHGAQHSAYAFHGLIVIFTYFCTNLMQISVCSYCCAFHFFAFFFHAVPTAHEFSNDFSTQKEGVTNNYILYWFWRYTSYANPHQYTINRCDVFAWLAVAPSISYIYLHKIIHKKYYLKCRS